MFATTNCRNPDLSYCGMVTIFPEKAPRQPPPCECPRCLQQYRTWDDQQDGAFVYQDRVDMDNAKEVCATLVKQTKQNRSYIRSQLSLKGRGIEKKWINKTTKNRESLLRQVDPTMHDKKWLEGYLGYESRYARKHRNICLLPYMNRGPQRDAF
jgi:hypothetical protein